MTKSTIPFEDFLLAVAPENQPFAAGVDDLLTQKGCARKIEPAKSGYLVSYSLLAPGAAKPRALLNFVFRKAGLVTRMYADHVGGYAELLDTLPAGLAKKVDKAQVCKNLVAPGTCSPHCTMGYSFSMGGTQYQKCKYSAFMFPVDEESKPALRALLEAELAARGA